MQVIFVSATRRFGTSSKTGKAYDMCNVAIAVPVEPKNTASMTFDGFGYEVREIDLDPKALGQFSSIKPFSNVDLTIEPKPDNFARTWVTSVIAK